MTSTTFAGKPDWMAAVADYVGMAAIAAANSEKIALPTPGIMAGGILGVVAWQMAGKQDAARRYVAVPFPSAGPTGVFHDVDLAVAEGNAMIAATARAATYTAALWVGAVATGDRLSLPEMFTIGLLGASTGTLIQQKLRKKKDRKMTDVVGDAVAPPPERPGFM